MLTQAQKDHLDEHGYLVLDNVLGEKEIEIFAARIGELAEKERADGSAVLHTNQKGQHVRWLVNKGVMFERLMTEPRVVPVFEYLLGANYILSTLTSNLIYPGAPDGGYHVDGAVGAMPEPLPSFPMTANSLWLLDDFTEENGGTRFVPGSHKRLRKPPPGLTHDPEEKRLTAPKGSVFIFNGATWHAAGANRTDQTRRCLICFCCRAFLKPQFDFVRYLDADALERATPHLRRLYGFDSQPRGPDKPTRPSAS